MNSLKEIYQAYNLTELGPDNLNPAPLEDSKGYYYNSITDFLMYNQLDFCSCGNPLEALKWIYQLLSIFNLPYDYDTRQAKLKELNTPQPALDIIFYQLTNLDILEHGSCILGWLTDKGKQFYDSLDYLIKNNLLRDE